MSKNPVFDYSKEPSRDILCLDCKSFYASCEAIDRGYDPLKVKLVVMSYPEDEEYSRAGALILASSPAAKKAYNISNVSRAGDLPYPYPEDLIIVAPRMNRYMEYHRKINGIYRSFVDDENIEVYSVDESFLDVTGSLAYFGKETADDLAQLIQETVYDQTGIVVSVGIGDNPLLAKLSLDNEAKHTLELRAEWRYRDVASKLWSIEELTDVWGIGEKTRDRLARLNIFTVKDLAHSNYYQLKKELGLVGTHLFAHAWGIDRSFLGEAYVPKSQSIGNSQVLPKDYRDTKSLEIVIREMADQVASRLRRQGKKAERLSLKIGYSYVYRDDLGRKGFQKQKSIQASSNSKFIANQFLLMFAESYRGQIVRTIQVTCSKLKTSGYEQLDLFTSIEEKEKNEEFESVVDKIRNKFGFDKLFYTSSLLEGSRALERSRLVGGHAGGRAGIEGSGDIRERKNG